MTSQLSTEVRRLHARNDYEQHRLLSMIERLHREGRSEQEIEAALHEAGAKGPRSRRSRSNTRPVRGRLARWAARHSRD
jgi:hypothetical protein